jgi:hypothetical protein
MPLPLPEASCYERLEGGNDEMINLESSIARLDKAVKDIAAIKQTVLLRLQQIFPRGILCSKASAELKNCMKLKHLKNYE